MTSTVPSRLLVHPCPVVALLMVRQRSYLLSKMVRLLPYFIVFVAKLTLN